MPIVKKLIFVSLLSFPGIVMAATVTTKSGSVYEGELVSQDESEVVIELSSGGKSRIARSEVASIQYDTGKPQGFHKHDGFFLRLLGGYGNLSFSESPVYSNGTGTLKASGPAGFFGFQLGVAVTENIILLGSLNGYAAVNPQYELNGVKATTTMTNSLGVSSYGLGLCFYLDSINAYLSADVGTAKTTLTVNNVQYMSDSGVGVNVQLGKEWWVSANWGIGAAIFYHYSSMNDAASGSVVPKITNSVIGVAFSATYN